MQAVDQRIDLGAAAQLGEQRRPAAEPEGIRHAFVHPHRLAAAGNAEAHHLETGVGRATNRFGGDQVCTPKAPRQLTARAA